MPKRYFIASLIQDKGKRKEFAIYSLDSDWAFNDCENVVRINTFKETIQQYVEANYGQYVS